MSCPAGSSGACLHRQVWPCLGLCACCLDSCGQPLAHMVVLSLLAVAGQPPAAPSTDLLFFHPTLSLPLAACPPCPSLCPTQARRVRRLTSLRCCHRCVAATWAGSMWAARGRAATPLGQAATARLWVTTGGWACGAVCLVACLGCLDVGVWHSEACRHSEMVCVQVSLLCFFGLGGGVWGWGWYLLSSWV